MSYPVQVLSAAVCGSLVEISLARQKGVGLERRAFIEMVILKSNCDVEKTLSLSCRIYL